MDLETGDNRFHCLEKVSFLSVQVTPLRSYLFFLSTHQRLEFFLEILNVFGQQWPAEFAVRRESDIAINVRESLHHSTEGRRFHLQGKPSTASDWDGALLSISRAISTCVIPPYQRGCPPGRRTWQ